MNKIKIFSDSTSDLGEHAEKNNISIIPLQVICGDNTYLDDSDLSIEFLFEWADKNKTTPKTAVCGIEFSKEKIKPWLDDGWDIIFLGISESMSFSCNAVRLAAEELGCTSRVHVIDSLSLSNGVAIQVLRAKELVDEGFSAEEIVRKITGDRDRVRASFVINTLTYLQRGGRCSAVLALAANTLSLKPKIYLKDGKMSVGKKYIGSIATAVKKYIGDMKPELMRADKRRIFVVDTMQPENSYIVENTVNLIKEMDIFEEVLIARAGSIISSHCGPNTLGVMFYDSLTDE